MVVNDRPASGPDGARFADAACICAVVFNAPSDFRELNAGVVVVGAEVEGLQPALELALGREGSGIVRRDSWKDFKPISIYHARQKLCQEIIVTYGIAAMSGPSLKNCEPGQKKEKHEDALIHPRRNPVQAKCGSARRAGPSRFGRLRRPRMRSQNRVICKLDSRMAVKRA